MISQICSNTELSILDVEILEKSTGMPIVCRYSLSRNNQEQWECRVIRTRCRKALCCI